MYKLFRLIKSIRRFRRIAVTILFALMATMATQTLSAYDFYQNDFALPPIRSAWSDWYGQISEEEALRIASIANDVRGWFSVSPMVYVGVFKEKVDFGYGITADIRLHGAQQYKDYNLEPHTMTMLLSTDVTYNMDKEFIATARLGWSAGMIRRGYRPFSQDPEIAYTNYCQGEGSLISVRYNFTTNTLYVPVEVGISWNNALRFGSHTGSFRIGMRLGLDLFQYSFETRESAFFPANLTCTGYLGLQF